MGGDDLFDFARPDLEAAGLDEVLLAVDEEEVAVVVEVADVAGEDPAVAEHVGGLFGALPIAIHDLGGADDDLAGGVGRLVQQAGLQVDDAQVDIGQGQPGGAVFFQAMHGANHGGQDGLGHGVGIQQAAVGELLETKLGLLQEGGGGGIADLHRFEIDLAGDDAGVIEQGVEQSGDAMQDGGTLFAQRGDQIVEVARVGDDDHGPAGEQGGVEGHVAVDVEEGHDQGEAVVPVAEHGAGVGVELGSGDDQGAVRGEDGLGLTGGAAAEEQDGGVGGPDWKRGGRGRGETLQEVGKILVAVAQLDAVAFLLLLEQGEEQGEMGGQEVLDMAGDDALDGGAGLDGFDLIVEGVEGDNGLGLALDEGVLELPLGVGGVDGAKDGAGLPGAELGDDGLGRVGEEGGDPFAAGDTEGEQGGGECVGEGGEAGVGEVQAFEDEGGVLGTLAHGVGEDVEEGEVRVGLEGAGEEGVVGFEPGAIFHRDGAAD